MAQQTDDEQGSTDRDSQAIRAFHRYVWYEVQGE
jgi:hypothetical protein